MLPTADFFGTQLTRLMLGDNPFLGNTYVPEHITTGDLLDYYTANHVVEAMFEAEKNGMNAYMAIGEPFVLRCIRQYRQEGGKMHVLFQSYPSAELEGNLRSMLAYEPLAIYHQGSTLDYWMEIGEVELVKSRLKLIRDTGVKTGLGTHSPLIVRQAEEEGWDIDFYMACLYNIRRQKRGQKSGFVTGKPKTEPIYFPEDPPLMMEEIRTTSKPVVAFKLLAGAQRIIELPPAQRPAEIERAFAQAYAGIKPGDFACIGVHQGQHNQIKENCEIAARVLAAQ